MTDRFTWLRISPGEFSAGRHDQSGAWIPVSTHDTSPEAAEAARVLNGDAVVDSVETPGRNWGVEA